MTNFKTEYTPGPWTVKNGQVWHYWGGDDTYAFTKVCEVFDTPGIKGLSLSNARLIAAAPDLLECLKGLEQIGEGKVVPDRIWGYIREAIARAEGRDIPSHKSNEN